jgi:exopolyphosphatase/guanosine-5'-triphosphate,3'-diphosphate pyrophosphatase
VNYQRHHKHSHYLILNADIAGLTERERALAGAIARFHRRSRPDRHHEVLQPFNGTEIDAVEKLSMMLRVADSLDRSHHQPVQSVAVRVKGRAVMLKLKARHSIDLELWDVAREEPLFQQVFGRTLLIG